MKHLAGWPPPNPCGVSRRGAANQGTRSPGLPAAPLPYLPARSYRGGMAAKQRKVRVELTATRTEGPPADPECYGDEIQELLDGQTIWVQDPDRDEQTGVLLDVTSVTLL